MRQVFFKSQQVRQILSVLALVSLFGLALGGSASGADIDAQSAIIHYPVVIDQVDWTAVHSGNVPNSEYGVMQLTITPDTTDIYFVNVVGQIDDGPIAWVVRNIVVFDSAGYAEQPMTTGATVDLTLLGVSRGQDVTGLDFHYDVWVDPVMLESTPPYYGEMTTLIGSAINNAEGDLPPGQSQGLPPPYPPPPSGPDLQRILDVEDVNIAPRPGMPNVEQGINECGPGGIANSMHWLDMTYPSIDLGTETLDQSLQKLKSDCKNGAWTGSGIGQKDAIEGKLRFAQRAEHPLPIVVKYQADQNLTDLDASVTIGTMTANRDPANGGMPPTLDFLVREMKNGEDVELSIDWLDVHGNKTGGHVVVVSGLYLDPSNRIKVETKDDASQGVTPGGLQTVQHHIVVEGGGTHFGLGGFPRNRVKAIYSESPVEELWPCICIDSAWVLPGHDASVRLNMCNMPEIGGFDFLVCYDPSGLNFLSAKPLGEVAEWEYFTYRYSYQDNCGGGCPTGYIRLIGIANMPDGETPDESVFQPDGNFAELTFGTSEDFNFIGQCFHLNYCTLECGDNTFSSRSGDTLYMAEDIEEILPDEDCLAGDKGPIPVPIGRFCHGIICIIPPPDDRGDINLNGVANEIADAVLFANYFIYGPGVWDPIYYENQILATDVNDDGIPLTVADLVYLIRIITGDANPYPESGEGGKITPRHLTAVVDWRIAGDHLTVDFTNESDAGAILLAFDHHGAEFGEPVLSDRASAMTMISHNNGAQLRVLLYGMERGANIPTGEGAILTIPITTTDPGLVLAEVEAADYYGNMMTVESTRPTYVPNEFALFQNIPNPFNATTRIDFNLPEAGEVTLVVYDVLGRKVATLVEGHLEPGAHHITWNSRDEYGAEVASGVYFYRITTDKHQASRKMVLVK